MVERSDKELVSAQFLDAIAKFLPYRTVAHEIAMERNNDKNGVITTGAVVINLILHDAGGATARPRWTDDYGRGRLRRRILRPASGRSAVC